MRGVYYRLRRFWLVVAIAFVALLLIVAVSGLRGGYDRDETLEVAVVLKATSPQIEFWQVVRQGIEAASRELDVEPVFVGPWFEHEIDEQIRILRSAIVQEPDGIVLAAADFDRLQPVVEEARAADIPIVTVDSDVAGDVAVSFVGTDSVEAGRKAGVEMLSLVDADSTIVIMSHVPEAATAIDRERGVFEALAVSHTGRVVGPLYAFNDEAIARDLIVEHIQSSGVPDGIIALNEISAIGVARTIDDLGLTGTTRIVGFDASADEVALLERGVIDALVVQKPFNMGYLSLEVLVEWIRGRTVRDRIDTGSEVVRRSNMYDESIQRLIFPLVR